MWKLANIKENFDYDIYIGDKHNLFIEVSDGKEEGWAYPFTKNSFSKTDNA